jgi:hypothetical protein
VGERHRPIGADVLWFAADGLVDGATGSFSIGGNVVG